MLDRVKAAARLIPALLLCLSGPVGADVGLTRDGSGSLRLIDRGAGDPSRFNVPPLPKRLGGSVIGFDAGAALEPRISFQRALKRRHGRFVARAHPTHFDPLIEEIAGRYGVDYALVKAVIKTESNFNPRAVSPKGARGLMQLMPATARAHNVRNSFSPRENIEGGVQHLRMLLDRYGGNLPLTLAAYNAGSGRVEAAGGVPDITETREYVVKVLRFRKQYLGAEDDDVRQARR
jgi:hypothetical protein